MISIIIPVYNVQKYLPQCLDSILAQTWQNWEAILVDDGSPDASGEICDQYAARDSRFRVIHKENGGAASAKNAGLDVVRGSYVAFVDSDDYVEPNWLEGAMSVIRSTNADVVEFTFDKIYVGGNQPGYQHTEPSKEFTAETYLGQYLDIWSNSLFWNKLFRAELMNGIRFRKERRCIDDEFFTYKVMSNATKILRINDVLYHYRQRRSSAVYNEKNRKQIADDALEILIERYEWVCKIFPTLRHKYLDHDVQILFYFAGFSHTPESVRKFRRVSRYYLRETLIYSPKLIPLALKLQVISTQRLLSPEIKTETKDTNRYFP